MEPNYAGGYDSYRGGMAFHLDEQLAPGGRLTSVTQEFPIHEDNDDHDRFPDDHVSDSAVAQPRELYPGFPSAMVYPGLDENVDNIVDVDRNENFIVDWEEAFLTFFDRTMMSQGDTGTCKQDADCAPGQGCAEGVCGELQGPYKVKPEQTFMMGDNRMNSHDSRGWFGGRGGGVPFSYIRGSALWVWMSFTLDGKIAWDRIGVSVMGLPKLPESFDANLGPRISECMKKHPGAAAATPPAP